MMCWTTHLRPEKVSVPLLSALIQCIFTVAHAAGPQFEKTPVHAATASAKHATTHARTGLKLDLGMTLKADDCEEDYADLLTIRPLPDSDMSFVKQPSSVKAGDAVLAKLAPVEKFNAGHSVIADDAPARRVVPALPVRAAQAPAIPKAPVVPVPVSASSAPASATWEIVPADKTLNMAIARWVAAAGWQLLWELPVDYAVDTRTTINGSFEDAVGLVVAGMETAEIPMKAIFYQGNRVLRIVAKGAE